jgi:arylsulfatase A
LSFLIWHQPLYYHQAKERDGRQAVRKGDWKLVKVNVLIPANTTTELFPDLSTSFGEQIFALEYQVIA